MTESSNLHSQLGEQIGAWLDASTTVPERESSEGALRQSVLSSLRRRQSLRRRTAWVGSAAGLSLVAFLGLRIYGPSSNPSAIEFRLLPGNGMGQVGAYVAPTSSAALDLKFSEGSVVELEPGARARVAATTSRGATVLLETGRASVNVVHRDKAEWTIMAGPYSVRVHGTAFSVEFDPKSQLFELMMRSGVVSVEGPGISRPVEIRGAQRFVHRAGLGLEPSDEVSKAVTLPPKNLEEAKESPTLDSAKTVGQGLPNVPVSQSKALTPNSDGTTASNWEMQVRRGEYMTVLKDAEAKGLSSVFATAKANELMALANAARFSGRVDIGRDAYKAIRSRFGSSSASISAAFLLGRLTEGASPVEARRWYEKYEQEAPRGALVAEAMGRRLVLTQTTGSRAEVQRLAEEYLRRFPDGPYSGVARKITSP
jgi:ferric-dicitrate binding protein FerR (iron transport regulator)